MQTSLSKEKGPRYLVYLLTCWQERDGEAGPVTWRFRLETPDSGQRQLFPNLEALVNALHQETEESSGR